MRPSREHQQTALGTSIKLFTLGLRQGGEAVAQHHDDGQMKQDSSKPWTDEENLHSLLQNLEVSKKVTIFAAAMINRTECIQKLQACKNVMTEKYGVHSMRLFGSVARNEQNESSDVDVCVEMEPSLLRRSGLKIYLEEMLKCKVDVLRVHKNMDSYLSQQIARDGILIFK